MNNTTGVINKANLILTGTQVYNATTSFAAANLTATGVAGQTFSLASGAGTTSTANVQTNQPLASIGTLVLGASGNGGIASNYNAISTTGSSVSITAEPLTVTAVTNTKTYDSTTSAAGVPTITSGALQGSDTANFIETYASANVGTSLTLTPSGTAGGNGGLNYSYTFVNNTTGVINKANLILTGTQVYNATTSFAAANLTATGVAGQTFSLASGAGTTSTDNVQTNQPLASIGTLVLGTSGNGGVASNYNAISVTGSSVSITPYALTVTAQTNTKTYDAGTTAAAIPSITTGTLQGSDTASFTEAYSTANVGTNLTLTPSGTAGGNGGLNYSYTFVNNTTGVINKANLTITGSGVYNGTTSIAGSNLTADGVAGQTFSLTGSGTLSTRNVQTNQPLSSIGTLVLGTSGNGGLASNYNTITVTGSSVSVTPEALTITAATNTKTYDATTTAAATPTITFGSVQPGDTANFTESYATANVGTNLTLTPAGVVTDGNSGNNYSYTYVTNTTGVINKANLTITGSGVYNGTSSIAGSNLTADGVAGQTFSLTGSGTLSTRNVQTNQPLFKHWHPSIQRRGNGG